MSSEAVTVITTVTTSGGMRRLKVCSQRSTNQGVRPASARRTKAPVMR